MDIRIRVSTTMLDRVRQHLLPPGSSLEHGAFLFCSYGLTEQTMTFECVEVMAMQPADYLEQATDYLELRDDTRARLIKRAHDSGLAIVETHSHPGPYPAALSDADLEGLAAFVPHVRWRLKNRPYAALVFARSGFDGLAWIGNDSPATQISRIETESSYVPATGLTLSYLRRMHHGSF